MTTSTLTLPPTDTESPDIAVTASPPPQRWSLRRTSRPSPPDLAARVALAEQQLPLQARSALYEAFGEREIDAEIALREWIRSKQRRQRKREFRAELTAAARDRRAETALARHDKTERRWHRRARAQQSRETNPDALEGMLHRRTTRSSRRLRAVMAVGLVWSAVSVGRNLVPDGGPGGPVGGCCASFRTQVLGPLPGRNHAAQSRSTTVVASTTGHQPRAQQDPAVEDCALDDPTTALTSRHWD
ncbi:hypothetical protein OH799_06645 [Nocardia sp. NBC_00881]|uniref:hypothetical protein n=1 Tax=Nocardia sp. NBC_00881 TaxID=2975995 RepID=UPI003869C8C6|nr:hypothetical protein OH799_06645 [Nocardia sp. NBC_00881]